MIRTLIVALGMGLALARPAAADGQVLKIATLAPEGSAWMKLFHEWASGIEKRAAGKLKIKFYAGGVAGDERDAVRKMRLGQISGAAITATGLGLIQPEVRALELPFIVHGYDELDYVRTKLDGEIRKKFLDKGYVLLNWGDVGPVHLFSNIPVKSKADLMQVKLWAWTDDPIVKTLFEKIGLNGVPLGVPDVLPSLQTGLINACYGSPLSTLALQWHSKVRYVSSMIILQAVGASVITKESWDKMPADLRAIVSEESQRLQPKLLKQVRDDNVASLKKMEAMGIQIVPTPEPVTKEFETQAKLVANMLEGKVFSHEFLSKVERLASEYRKNHK